MADGVDGRETLMERIPTLHQNEKYRHKVFRIQQRIRCTIGTIIDIITLRQERIITRIRPAWEEPGMTGRQITVCLIIILIPVMLLTVLQEARILLLNFGS